MARSVSERLGAFVAEAAWQDVAPALRQEATRTLLNHLGCALGVTRDPAVRIAYDVMRACSAAPAATVVGQAVRLDAMGAAFVNAVASNLLDYDDTHLRTVIHPAAPVAPPVLALAEAEGRSGAEALHAILLGTEVACRVGNGVSPGHYARGWHITSTCGVIGAAAACAKLLGLPAAQVAHAIGIATSQSAGTVENLPTAAKNVSVGSAARNGILAALLARAGYEAAPLAIEGPLGWARATGDTPDVDAMLDGLGISWEAARNTYKPYPAGIVFHAVIDACLELRERLGGPDGDAVAAVEVAGDSLLLERGDRVVNTARDARVSIHHCVALGLLRGRAGVAEFEAPAVFDPAVVALRAKVMARSDPAMPRGAARVTLRLADGRQEVALVEHPRGSAARPLDDAELDAKFRDNAALGGFAGHAEDWIAAIRGIADLPDVGALMRRLAAP
jgi:2-methylcitrate dehydratase PrpD